MKKIWKKKKSTNEIDTEINKVKLIQNNKGWFVTEGKNEACATKQAIPGYAAGCRKSVLQFIMDCTLIFIQKERVSPWNVLTAAMWEKREVFQNQFVL